MEMEKTGVIVAALVMFAVLAVAITANMTGNIISDVESATSPVIGFIILLAFIVAGYFVTRGVLSEGKYHVDAQ
ncbi:MAG: hypothetical protein V1648_02590 [Candidatus Aenigmatarchaeota archaeon]